MFINKFILITFFSCLLTQTPGSFSITRIHYGGGGDWYSDPSSIPNLLNFIDKNTTITTNLIEQRVKIGDDLFHRSKYLYITGHGNIKFTNEEILK